MHRRKDLYGDDADEFRPDRWDSNPHRGPDLKNIGWGYLPFNGGPRICLGREWPFFPWSSFAMANRDLEEFAILEASYTIVRLLQTFGTIELAEAETEYERMYPKHTVTLVMASADGCKVRLAS